MQRALLGVRRLCSSSRIAALRSSRRHLASRAPRENEVHGRSSEFPEEGRSKRESVEEERYFRRSGHRASRDDRSSEKPSKGYRRWTFDESYVPARSDSIDGRAYADWGRVKWRPVDKDKQQQDASKRRSSSANKDRNAASTDDNLKSSKPDHETFRGGRKQLDAGKSSARNEVSKESSGSVSRSHDERKAFKPSVVEVAEPDSKSGWCASYRDRVEQALVEKGLVSEAEKPKDQSQTLSRFTDAESDEDEDDEDSVTGSEAEADSDEDGDSENAEASDEDQDDEESDEEEAEAEGASNEEVEEDSHVESFHEEQRMKRAAKAQERQHAQALIQALEDDSEEGGVKKQHQKLLKAAIVGAPNAGKSCLMNYLVGTKVSAVSRKTNTTRSEILGVLTEGDTQILFYDTPGLMVDFKGQPVRQDTKNRVQSAWMVTNHCDVLVVLVDAHRQIGRPDKRVKRLIDKVGAKRHPTQKRVLCLNKVDLVRNKRELVPLAQELGGLPGFDSVFMISGLRGGGVRHLKEFLLDQAVLCPWEEEEGIVTDMNPVMIAKDVVWEHVLNNVHQEIPYELRHKHISWKVLRDQSIRIEQQLIVQTNNQKKIVVGKKGALIRKIGMSANEEISQRLGRKIHLILDVKVASGQNMYASVEHVPEEMFM